MEKKQKNEKKPMPRRSILSLKDFAAIGSAVVAVVIAFKEIKDIVSPIINNRKKSYNKENDNLFI